MAERWHCRKCKHLDCAEVRGDLRVVASQLGVEVRDDADNLLSDPIQIESEDDMATKKTTKKPAKKPAVKKPAAKKPAAKKPAAKKPAAKKPAAKKPKTPAASKEAKAKDAATVKETKPEKAKPKTNPTHKQCSRCDTKKPIDKFGKYGRSPDGHRIYCKDCVAEHRKAKVKTNG